MRRKWDSVILSLMYGPNSNPDLRKYDGDEWVTCRNCGYPMLPLKSYEIQSSSETPGVGADDSEVMLFGWWAYVYNYLYDLFTLKEREQKLARRKAEVLPRSPNALVCPACLEVRERR